jgi:hypothetical protein
MLPLEGTLLEKLRKIEALHAGTAVEGERESARRAAERIRDVSPSFAGGRRKSSIGTRWQTLGSAGCSSRSAVATSCVPIANTASATAR